jgi:flagellar FliL protein
MAENEQAEGAAEGTEAAAAPKSKLKLIIAVVGLVVILGGGGATWFLFFRHHDEEAHAEAAAAAVKPPSFVDVPELMVNLAGNPGERVQYLKAKIVLEIKEEKQVEAIKPSMPRVTDIFQTYLHELRPADLNGSAGLFRLKEELTKRVNLALAPIPVSAVLFKEIVVQ